MATDALNTDTIGTDTLGADQASGEQSGIPAPVGGGLPDFGGPLTPPPSAFDNTLQAPPHTNAGKGIGARIIAAAEHYLGVPYQWGGTSASGVDCSGLVQLAYKAAGIDLPRISFQQANAGKRVPLSQLRPGDLVAWDNSPRNNGADHIAIALGNGMVIEAPHPGGRVQIVKITDIGEAWGVRMPW